jgi:hypothetical protein
MYYRLPCGSKESIKKIKSQLLNMSSMIDYGKYEFIFMKDIIVLMMVATKTVNITFDMSNMALRTKQSCNHVQSQMAYKLL